MQLANGNSILDRLESGMNGGTKNGDTANAISVSTLALSKDLDGINAFSLSTHELKSSYFNTIKPNPLLVIYILNSIDEIKRYNARLASSKQAVQNLKIELEVRCKEATSIMQQLSAELGMNLSLHTLIP